MSLLKSSMLNAVAVIVRVGTGLILNKILAIFVGPSGYAVIGQFQNFVSIATTFATGGVNTGVIKLTAEYHADEERQHTVWRSAIMMSTLGAILIGALVICFRGPLAQYFLHDVQYADVIFWFGVSLVLLVWNSLLLAILNGLKQLHQFVAINILGSVIGLITAIVLVTGYGLRGALLALVVSQAVALIAGLLICYRAAWFKIKNFWGEFDRGVATKLAGFALMALVSAVAVPGSQMVVRDHLASEFGLIAAGYWQAITKISDVYLLLITTTLSYYYLPRLSEIKSGKELKREVLNAYKFILPLAGLLAFCIYTMRALIVRALFSESFLPMETLFFWQLVGDMMKIGSWLLAFLMLAREMTKRYIVTEILFSISLVALTMLFTKYMGVTGAVFAFALNYFLYWVIMYIVCHDAFK